MVKNVEIRQFLHYSCTMKKAKFIFYILNILIYTSMIFYTCENQAIQYACVCAESNSFMNMSFFLTEF